MHAHERILDRTKEIQGLPLLEIVSIVLIISMNNLYLVILVGIVSKVRVVFGGTLGVNPESQASEGFLYTASP